MKQTYEFNPKLDLLLERILDAPPETVWQAWNRQDHLDKGFYDGWGACMDQLAELVKGGRSL